MYLVNEKPPKDCFNCPYRTKCNVWEKFLKLSLDKADIMVDDLELLQPRVFTCCKIYLIPAWVTRFYFKWIKGKCRHNCYVCKHKNKCEIFLTGESE